jgi:uncharacterized phage protein (TIGR01671 family)
MREIKFRYTVKRESGYVFSRIFTISEIEIGEVIVWANANIVDLDRVNREQFTGLLDKNGREIYEGDIVQCSDAAFYRIVTYLTIRASFFFVHRDSWYPAAVATTSHAETVVVGNIHENPELLS